MIQNAAERKSVRASEKAARQAQRQDDDVLSWIMTGPEGRTWIHNLLLRCHVGANPFSPEPIVMAHNCGELNVGIQLWNDLMRVCPDQYVQMMREANGRDSTPPQHPTMGSF